MLDVAHVALCGRGNCGFLWGRMTIEQDDCKEYIHCILMLVDCISLSLHSIFDHGVTKSKKCYIKSMAQHEMLSCYRDCGFVLLK
jgi:hypothetical protein